MSHKTENNTQSPKPSQPPKKDLERAPVWRFVLPFLVVFLALGGNQEQIYANDANLYAAEIPSDAAFARVVYFAEDDQSDLSLVFYGQKLALSSNQASEFFILDKKNLELSFNEQEYTFAVEPHEYVSIAIGYDSSANAPHLIGSIRQRASKSAKSIGKNKARLHLYNFLPKQTANLELVQKNMKVISSVMPSAHGFREVNPVTVALQVAGREISDFAFAPMQLRGKRDYSFFVHPTSNGTSAFFVEDKFSRQ